MRIIHKLTSKYRIIFIFCLSVLMLSAVFFLNSCAKKETIQDGSVQVENFSLTLVDGKTWQLDSYKNKPVMLAFMAPNCPYCKMSTGMTNKLFDDYSRKGLQVISIFSNSDLEEIKEFIEHFNIKNKVSYNSKEVVRKFKIRGYPYFFLLDREHKVQEYWIGYHPTYDEEFLAEINLVLQK